MKHRSKIILLMMLSAVLMFTGCGTAASIEINENARETVTVTAAPMPEAQKDPAITQTPSPVPEETAIPEETDLPEAESMDSVPFETPAGEDEESEGSAEEAEENTERSEEASSEEVGEQTAGLSDLIVMSDPWEYTYMDMMYDAELIQKVFPGLVTADCLAVTADGREIVHFVAGNPEAEKKVFINAGTHGREYITCQLVMKQLAEYLRSVSAGESYAGVSYADMWNSVAVHVVPMVNPDGVSISQLGLDGIQTEDVLQAVYSIAEMDGAQVSDYYLDHWKANALGTDINRNYDAYWEEYNDPAGHPSSDHYKGEYPGSSIEAAAMIALTQESNFLRTISYHAQGGLIYWNFDNIDAIYDEAIAFASQLSNATGYPLDSNYEIIDPAGYSDWGIYRCQIPSVTIEVGYGECPYLNEQFGTIWQQNLYVFETTVLSVM